MAITLDHVMVLSHNKVEAGTFLARILKAPCGQAKVGPFFAVYINDSLTIDFDEATSRGPGPRARGGGPRCGVRRQAR